MDQGLFSKYNRQLTGRTDAKQKIISFLLEKTGITIEESELSLIKKEVVITTSSVKKSTLIRKGCESFLHSLGYTLHL